MIFGLILSLSEALAISNNNLSLFCTFLHSFLLSNLSDDKVLFRRVCRLLRSPRSRQQSGWQNLSGIISVSFKQLSF